MSLSLAPSLQDETQSGLTKWWPVMLGLVALLLPTYYSLAHGMWNTEENAHGPIVFALALWMFWRKRAAFTACGDVPRPVTGTLLLVVGLLLYVVGRSQGVPIFEVGSQIPILIATLLILRGPRTLAALWFPVFFLFFMVPVPGLILDNLTGPLKEYVSDITEHLLYAANYPIARSGVVLTIGPYQLLVADACSGLHSMYSLSAMGLFYLYLMRHDNVWRNIILALAILPFAFFANVVRVVVLVLVTYYFGDEAGQGILHGFAGITLFIFGLLLLLALDSVLGMFLKNHRAARR